MGKIKETKTRTQLTIDKDMKAELEAIAKAENRSFNNLVITILTDYLREKEQ